MISWGVNTKLGFIGPHINKKKGVGLIVRNYFWGRLLVIDFDRVIMASDLIRSVGAFAF